MPTPLHIAPYTMNVGEPLHKAFFRLSQFRNHRIVVAVNDEGQAEGIVTLRDITDAQQRGVSEDATLGEMCNRNFKSIAAADDLYTVGRNIFADAGLSIADIPVLDNSRTVVGIFSRWQAFYREHLVTGRLERPWYAVQIMDAAKLAKAEGYSDISVIEFGVAGGTGLVLAEMYAKETARLTGVNIQVYGFDRGTGLPQPKAGDDAALWREGDFPMDLEALRSRLQSAKLILGDVSETAGRFFADHAPAPVGAVFVDVDLYSATVPILDMLKQSDEHFLPIVFMYFDDLLHTPDVGGEWLALREFNASTEASKIVPESYLPMRWVGSEILLGSGDHWARPWAGLCKSNVRYSHPRYSTMREGSYGAPLVI